MIKLAYTAAYGRAIHFDTTFETKLKLVNIINIKYFLSNI